MTSNAPPRPDIVKADAAMPTLRAALDPFLARRAFARDCPALAHEPPIAAIRILRYRPGRRCLLRYGFADGTPAVIGKVTAKGVHRRGLAVQQRLRRAGFDGSAHDRIAVPEPLGAVPSLGLWLQCEVPGRPLQDCLDEPWATSACERAATTLVKLHRVPPEPETRAWTIADELALLDERLGRLAACRTDLGPAVEALRRGCHAAAARLPKTTPRGIHRDYYPEQLVVDGALVHLVDLDLYSLGDPALDAGNFIAHLTEAAIRTRGDRAAYAPLVAAFRDRFLAESPGTAASSVAIYTLLSLARLAEISTRMADRRRTTRAILEACAAPPV
jgi:hypothetical protein